MSTWLNEKEAVAENLGKTDGSTYNAKREGALNRARRKYHSERQWKYLTTVGATLTFTSQVASLPSDYNHKFDPLRIYTYVGNALYEYRQVEWADLTSYGTADYVFARDPKNKTVKVSQTSATLSLDYTYLPVDKTATDGSQDADIEPAPDTTAIELLGTAYFFMSSRQSKGSYQQFLDGYSTQVQADTREDAGNTPPRFFHPTTYRLNTGYRGRS